MKQINITLTPEMAYLLHKDGEIVVKSSHNGQPIDIHIETEPAEDYAEDEPLSICGDLDTADSVY